MGSARGGQVIGYPTMAKTSYLVAFFSATEYPESLKGEDGCENEE